MRTLSCLHKQAHATFPTRQAYGSVDLVLLNDLARRFPLQATQLLQVMLNEWAAMHGL